MIVSRKKVEVFLRISIFVCTIAFGLMIFLMIFNVGGWGVWLPPAIACAGVALSFGVHLNTLQGKTVSSFSTDATHPKPAGSSPLGTDSDSLV